MEGSKVDKNTRRKGKRRSEFFRGFFQSMTIASRVVANPVFKSLKKGIVKKTRRRGGRRG